MKKLLTGILTLSLAASLAVPAFAADNTATNDGSKGTDIPVSGVYQAGAPAAEVISVDLVWDAMDFTYTEGEKGDWNPYDHEYYNGKAGTWAWDYAPEDSFDPLGKYDPVITVTNHSNVYVAASFAFDSSVEGLNGYFEKESFILATAENTEVAKAPNVETEFWVGGVGIDSDKTLGTITVTVAKYVIPAMQTISNAEDLLATGSKGGVFKLENDIDLGTGILTIDSGYYVLDLDGHTLSNTTGISRSTIKVFGGNVTIKNGTVKNNSNYYSHGIDANSEKFVLENCSVVANTETLKIGENTTAYVTDCKIQATNYSYVLVTSGDLTLSGSVNLKGSGFNKEGGTVNALPGTYNFDVSEYVDINRYSVTNNAGIWTVIDTPTVMNTFEALQAVVKKGGKVTLEYDITFTGDQKLEIPYGTEVTLDLNGHTLTGGDECVLENNGTLTIKNGEIVANGSNAYSAINNYASSLVAENLTVENNSWGYAFTSFYAKRTVLIGCTLYSKGNYAAYLEHSDAKITSCTFSTGEETYKDVIKLYTAKETPMTLTIGGNTQVNNYIWVEENSGPITVVLEADCTLNLADHIDESSELTDNGNGTWTITWKSGNNN